MHDNDMLKTLRDFKVGCGTLSRETPAVLQSWVGFVDTAMRESHLPAHTKELIALGMAITAHCKPCIGMHVEKCRAAGVTREEIVEVCAIAMVMGGGPTMTYICEVDKALKLFYGDPDEDD